MWVYAVAGPPKPQLPAGPIVTAMVAMVLFMPLPASNLPDSAVWKMCVNHNTDCTAYLWANKTVNMHAFNLFS